MKISVVTTLYNSRAYIPEFYRRTKAELERITDDYEFIFVDDGSPDDSLGVALPLLRNEIQSKVIELSRNFGHHKAMMTGLEHASGDLVFLIDIDLEEPPELLSVFYDAMRTRELDVVYGIQEARKGGVFERIGGGLAWKALDIMLPVKIPMNHSTVRLMTRDYVRALVLHKEQNTAIGGLWVLTGFRQEGLAFMKGSRRQTSYSYARRVRALLDSVTSFSELPLLGVFYLGCVIMFGSALMIAYLLFRAMTGNLAEGWLSIVVSISFFGGLTIFSIGVLGLYISRIFIETKDRPYTVIRSIQVGKGTSLLKVHANGDLQEFNEG